MQSAQTTFASPDAAGAALLAAAMSGDRKALTGIFGPDSTQALFTGDEAADKAKLQEFVSAYGKMHRWSKIKAGGEVLQVGTDNYPFPIPLGQNSSGQWYFDTAAGKDEMLARRIGRNELKAIDACEAIAIAERQYHGQLHDGGKVKQYAQRFVSDSGTHNGLYWPASEGQPPSPLGDLSDFTKVLSSSAAAGQPPMFNGYYYRILTRSDTPHGAKEYLVKGRMTGGFTILAYPAEYRQSGIMSFLADNTGALYQKDLGEHTSDVAAAAPGFNPGDGWTAISIHTGMATRTEQ